MKLNKQQILLLFVIIFFSSLFTSLIAAPDKDVKVFVIKDYKQIEELEELENKLIDIQKQIKDKKISLYHQYTKKGAIGTGDIIVVPQISVSDDKKYIIFTGKMFAGYQLTVD
jgi:hypothetical protein